jgi:hypothetical protein
MLRRSLLLAVALVVIAVAPATAAAAVVVEGEAPERSNIPTVTHRAASGGAYLRLSTRHDPPRAGWYASYKVNAPAAGPYRLDAVVLPPATADSDELGGSYFEVAVGDGPFEQLAKPDPVWSAMPGAWGALVRARLDDLALERGDNRITFRVSDLRVGAPPIGYHFALDRFRLTPRALALTDASPGELGVTGDERPTLRFTLNARAPEAQTVSYTVSDYFGEEQASGVGSIAAGASRATAELPPLPPGHYRVRARLSSSPQTTFAGSFARLPDRPPVDGPANRFGVTGLIAVARAARAARSPRIRVQAYGRRIRPR